MKAFIPFLLVFVVQCSFAQVRKYQIQHSMGLTTIPYSISKSNDGNLLISDMEPNLNVGFSHVIKVKPSGDTLFIKTTDAPYIYVTQNGNILSNQTEYDIAVQSVTESYITMRDKNFNMKWQLDLSSNFAGAFTVSPPIVQSFLELNPNRFLCTVATYTGSSMVFAVGAAIEFDSIGTVLSMYSSPVYGNWFLDGKFNQKWISHSTNQLTIADLPFNNTVSIRVSSIMPDISDVYYSNNKIYVASKLNQGGNKAMLLCIDTNFVVLWAR